MKYLKEPFYFLVSRTLLLVTRLATPNCLYNFERKFTRICGWNPRLILIYANGYNHQV